MSVLLLAGCGTFTGYDVNVNAGTQLSQMPYGVVNKPVYGGGLTFHYDTTHAGAKP